MMLVKYRVSNQFVIAGEKVTLAIPLPNSSGRYLGSNGESHDSLSEDIVYLLHTKKTPREDIHDCSIAEHAVYPAIPFPTELRLRMTYKPNPGTTSTE